MQNEELKKLYETNQNLSFAKDMEIHEEDLDVNGCQVARGEYFAHRYEPCFTFHKMKIYINKASIIKLPNVEYIQLLINEKERKLMVKPTLEEEMDSFRWCTRTRNPRQISCKLFYIKIMNLMNWNPEDKHKLLGKLVRSNDELMFVFHLDSVETFIHYVTKDGKEVISRNPSYPEDWKNQFGIPVAEHQMRLKVNIFEGFALVNVEKQKKETPEITETEKETEDGTE